MSEATNLKEAIAKIKEQKPDEFLAKTGTYREGFNDALLRASAVVAGLQRQLRQILDNLPFDEEQHNKFYLQTANAYSAGWYDCKKIVEKRVFGGQSKAKTSKRPKKIIDIADMPNFNPDVKNGIHSVSEGKIFWTENNYVTCREHGACLCVSKDGKIWRCPTCNEGAYVEWREC